MENAQQAGDEPEPGRRASDEQRAREREALRRRVSESLVRCPDAGASKPA